MKASVEQRILQRLEEFTEALEQGKEIGEHFTCREVTLKVEPKEYNARKVNELRSLLGVSQSVLAVFLGVSPKTIAAWERGTQAPTKIACRFMDEIRNAPELFRRRLGELARAK